MMKLQSASEIFYRLSYTYLIQFRFTFLRSATYHSNTILARLFLLTTLIFKSRGQISVYQTVPTNFMHYSQTSAYEYLLIKWIRYSGNTSLLKQSLYIINKNCGNLWISITECYYSYDDDVVTLGRYVISILSYVIFILTSGWSVHSNYLEVFHKRWINGKVEIQDTILNNMKN